MARSDRAEANRLIGSNLQRLRKGFGLSQSDLAAELADAGYPFRQQTILKIEKGTRPLRLDEAAAIATILHIRIDDLVDTPGAEQEELIMSADRSPGPMVDEPFPADVIPSIQQIRNWCRDAQEGGDLAFDRWLDTSNLARWGPTFQVLDQVHDERERQDRKWGEQNHPNGTGPNLWLTGLPVNDVMRGGRLRRGVRSDGLERWAKHRCQHPPNGATYERILTEEWAEALATNDQSKLRAELVQVAAVAVAWVEKIDRQSAEKR